MAKRKPQWCEKLYWRFLKEGRGTGEGGDYLPWFTIHDHPADGTFSRVPGHTTGRMHHFFNRLQENYFFTIDGMAGIEDIREHFPLRLRETLKIAEQLNVKHPARTGFPYVITADFFITKDGEDIVRCVTKSKNLEKKSIREKMAIQFEYWNRRGIDWKILTEKEIQPDHVANCKWLRTGEKLEHLMPDPLIRAQAVAAFVEMYADISIPFTAILHQIESAFPCPEGTGIALFKYAILHRLVDVDITKHIDLQEPRNMSVIL